MAWGAFSYEARSQIATHANSVELVRAPKTTRCALIAGDFILSTSGEQTKRRAISDVSRDLMHFLDCDVSSVLARGACAEKRTRQELLCSARDVYDGHARVRRDSMKRDELQ